MCSYVKSTAILNIHTNDKNVYAMSQIISKDSQLPKNNVKVLQCIFFSQGLYAAAALFKLASHQSQLRVIDNGYTLYLTKTNRFLHAYSLLKFLWVFFAVRKKTNYSL